jgi:adiponectin receptor
MSLRYVVRQGALYIIGAGLYASRTPERKWPGRFDVFGASHQIFHLLVLAAAAVHLRGLVLAFHHKHQGKYAAVRLFGSDAVEKKTRVE